MIACGSRNMTESDTTLTVLAPTFRANTSMQEPPTTKGSHDFLMGLQDQICMIKRTK